MAKTLTVYLAADLKKLSGGLDQAKGDLRGFDASVNESGGRLTNMLAPALLGAGAAAAAFGAKLAVDAVNGAIEDEKSLTKLNTTLNNLGFGTAAGQVEQLISSMASATGTADDQLRPAMDRLVRATGDVGEAEKALALAHDISTGTGKSLEAVANALGKAYEGNTGALGKLGTGLDKATLKTGDMDAITGKLASTFGGQAQAQANTFGGKLDRITNAANEASEMVGYSLINAMDQLSGVLGGTDGTVDLISQLGQGTADSITGFSILIGKIDSFRASAANTNPVLSTLAGWLANIYPYLPGAGIATAVNEMGKAGEAARKTAAEITASISPAQDMINAYIKQRIGVSNLTPAVNQHTTALHTNTGAAKQDTAAQDALNAAYQAQSDVVQTNLGLLDEHVRKLKDAEDAVSSYVSSMADALMSEFSIGDAYKAAIGADGKVSVDAWMKGVDDQAARVDWFGNVLAKIKEVGGKSSQNLIDYLKGQGAAQGGAMAQALIDEGVIPQMIAKYNSVVDASKTLAATLVPDQLIAGQNYAEAMLRGTATELLASETKLRQIGQSIGKPIGANLKAEITKALADAFAEAEKAKSAAQAAGYASAAAAQVTVTAQSTAQVLNQIIGTANNRTGYSNVDQAGYNYMGTYR